MFAHVKVKALEACKARRVENDTVEAEALLFRPAHILNRISAEEFSRTQIKAIERIIFTTLIEDFPADIRICSKRSTAQTSMYRETARIAEQIKEPQTFARLSRTGHRTEPFFHFKAHMAHVKEESRINRIHQIHMELGHTFTHHANGIFARTNHDIHRCIFKRASGTRKAFLHDNTNRIEQRRHSSDNFILAQQKFRPEKLYLKTIAITVNRQSRKTVSSPVHNAISIRHIGQRRTFSICGLKKT